MSNVYREGMDLPNNDDMTPSSRKPPRRAPKPVAKPAAKKPAPKPAPKPLPRTKLPPLEPGESYAPFEPDDGSIGLKCGGKVKKYAGGGAVRGDGIASKGRTKGRMC